MVMVDMTAIILCALDGC